MHHSQKSLAFWFCRSESSDHSCRGIALLLVLAILAVTLALVYGLSRSSVTMYKLSSHESTGLQASSAAEIAQQHDGRLYDALATEKERDLSQGQLRHIAVCVQRHDE